jgi:ankyrin repeat protein
MVLSRYLWVDCQLERIRRCHASELKRILDELPKTLDETYARILREIPDEYYDRAHRLLQCLTVAVHPLDVSQLASVLAVDVTAKGIPTLNMDARGEDEEQVIRSACSSLVTIVEDRGRRVVQFSHFSIKEFLISEHFSTPAAQDVARYRVLPDSAHKFMAHACIATLLQLDYRTYRTGTQNFPLAYYAAVHLATHAEFGNVISHIRRGLDVLLDADKPHLSAWIQVVRPQSQISEQPAPLNWAVVLGFPVIVEYLMSTRPQDLNAKGCFGYTPLHQAAFRQYIKITRLLLAKGADAGIQSNLGETPLHLASARGHNDIVQLLLDLNDHRTKIPTLFRWVKNNVFLKLPRPNKIIHARNICGQTPLHEASQCGRSDTIRLLLDRGANVDSRDDLEATPLLLASSSSKWDEKPLKLLIECGANVHAQDKCGRTALHEASYSSNLVIMRLLLDNGVEADSRDDRNSTPLHRASLSPFGHYAKSVKLLIENGSNVHARDSNGKTPLHLVSGRKPEEMILLEKGADVDTQDEKNNTRPVELLVEHGANVHARDSRGETPLHLASKVGSFKKMMLLLEKGADVDAQDNENNTPLHLAASSGFDEGPVKLLVEHGANVHAKNWLGETPFQVASTVGDGQAREFLSTLAHDQS